MKNAKLAVLNEWDVHLRTVHPRQWEREQRKGDRRRAAAERSAQKKNGIEGRCVLAQPEMEKRRSPLV